MYRSAPIVCSEDNALEVFFCMTRIVDDEVFVSVENALVWPGQVTVRDVHVESHVASIGERLYSSITLRVATPRHRWTRVFQYR